MALKKALPAMLPSATSTTEGIMKVPDSRIKCTSDFTIYVDPINGDDNNNGISATTALATFTGLRIFLGKMDGNGFALTVRLAAATYTSGLSADGDRLVGFSQVTILGAGIDQTIFDGGTAKTLIGITANAINKFIIQALTVKNCNYGIHVIGAVGDIRDVKFDTCTIGLHTLFSNTSIFNVTFAGTFTVGIYNENEGFVAHFSNNTITLASGMTVTSAFVQTQQGSATALYGTFSGTVSGRRAYTYDRSVLINGANIPGTGDLYNEFAATQAELTAGTSVDKYISPALAKANFPRLVTATTNLYINADTGNDANNGLSATTAVKTWAVLHSILDKMSFTDSVVTLNISGLIAGTVCYLNVPSANRHNLIIQGNALTDGFAGSFNVLNTSLTISGTLHAEHISLNHSLLWCASASIGVNSLNLYQAEAFIADTTITLSGSVSNITRVEQGSLCFSRCTFTSVAGQTASELFYALRDSSILVESPTFDDSGGKAITITGYSIYLQRGGRFTSTGTFANMPGGGSTVHYEPAETNAIGIPRAYGVVAANGSLPTLSRNYNVVNCAKTGVGSYLITFSSPIPTAFSPQIALFTVFDNTLTITNPSITQSTVTVTIRNTSNSLVDAPFAFVVF